MQTLVECSAGEKYQFVGFSGNLPEEQHLRNLGFIKLSPLEVVSKSKDGLIVKIKESRVTIPSDVAKFMKVDEITEVIEHKFLSEIPVGGTVSTIGVIGSGAAKRRLMDMGITKGTKLEIIKVAPLGDPIEIKVRGYQLSLRSTEADLVLVRE